MFIFLSFFIICHFPVISKNDIFHHLKILPEYYKTLNKLMYSFIKMEVRINAFPKSCFLSFLTHYRSSLIRLIPFNSITQRVVSKCKVACWLLWGLPRWIFSDSISDRRAASPFTSVGRKQPLHCDQPTTWEVHFLGTH